jgi:hypothetical protein
MGERDRGSVLMLMPAAMLVVVLLGSIAVDMSAVFLARRDLVAAAAAAANDAVTYGLDERAYREHGQYVLDPSRVARAVELSLDARDVDLAATPVIAIDGTSVSVTLTAEVDYVFARAIPGVPHSTAVSASAAAVPRE